MTSSGMTVSSNGEKNHPIDSSAENDSNDDIVYKRLQTQVEFYFSPKNLSRDTYLRQMLISEHADMPTPRPSQYTCPVGIITNFPKVKDICSQFSPRQQNESAALLLKRAVGGDNTVVAISSDGNWIGPANQILPPLAMMGVTAGTEVAMGQPPPRIPPHFRIPGYQHQQQGLNSIPNPMHGMMGIVPPPPPDPLSVQQMKQQGEGQVLMYRKNQERGKPFAKDPSPMGYESPSSTSLESLAQNQQQQAYVSNLPPAATSKNSVDAIPSAASLSSMSDPVAKGGNLGSGVEPRGTGDTFPPPLGSSLSPMIVDHNTNALPPNPVPPSLQRMYPLHPWSGMMQYPPQQFSYYHPQQMQHVMYSQHGGAPQPMQQPQMQHYPAYSQLGFGVRHPPPPQQGYPRSYIAYKGMQQYVDYVGGGMQYHGYSPPPPHPSQFQDNRYLDMPGYFHSNDQHHGGGENKKRFDKKKYKSNQQQQQHHWYQRDSYCSSTSGTTGLRNDGKGAQHNLQRRESTTSPPIGEHHRGSGGNKSKKSGEQQFQYRRGNSNTSPSGLNNRSYNQLKDHHGDRLTSNDTKPSSNTSPQHQRKGKVDDNEDIFTSSDFPGLEGWGGDEQQLQLSGKKPNTNLVGYASALLKKKDVVLPIEESKDDTIKSAAAPVTHRPSSSPTVNKFENLPHQKEESEYEIQNSLYDLSLVGNGHNADDESNQNEGKSYIHDSGTDGETNVFHQLTDDTSSFLRPGKSNSDNEKDIGGKDVMSQSADHSTSEFTLPKSRPVIDVFNSIDFPAREATKAFDGEATGGPNAANDRVALTPELLNDRSSIHRAEKHNPPGAWGKRLFADVSFTHQQFQYEFYHKLSLVVRSYHIFSNLKVIKDQR